MYYTVITTPMDLSLIQSKIDTDSYTNLCEVEADFKIMVNNCETFNGPRNGYTSMVHAVWKAFRRAVKRFMNQDVSEDEQTVFMYPPGETKCCLQRQRLKHGNGKQQRSTVEE